MPCYHTAHQLVLLIFRFVDWIRLEIKWIRTRKIISRKLYFIQSFNQSHVCFPGGEAGRSRSQNRAVGRTHTTDVNELMYIKQTGKTRVMWLLSSPCVTPSFQTQRKLMQSARHVCVCVFVSCPQSSASVCYVLSVYASVSPSAVGFTDHRSLATGRRDLAEFVRLSTKVIVTTTTDRPQREWQRADRGKTHLDKTLSFLLWFVPGRQKV